MVGKYYVIQRFQCLSYFSEIMSGWCKLPSCIACVQTPPSPPSLRKYREKGDVCTQATSCPEVFLILIRWAVYSRTAFIGNFTSISGV